MESNQQKPLDNQLKRPDMLVEIENIITVYYNEFTKSYYFDGEKHDFWELVYVDKGEVEVSADGMNYQLSEGDIIFHRPNEFHTIGGNGIVASNVLVISFVSHSPVMTFFEKKIMKLTENERKILGSFIQESKRVFVDDLGRLYQESNRLASPAIGAEQMMYLYLQQFLIQLIRVELEPVNFERSTGMLKKTFKDSTINKIILYLQENMSQTVLLDDICNEFYLSKTYLKRFFKNETGYTVMTYLKALRMEEAKKLIREDNLSFTEIAQQLGFDSVHYFSTSFKKYEGLSPSDYEKSIKAYEEKISS
ncbi:AraC family transcriptional regulator [Vagococcus carniphilus]|uniref:AraC family transcriptional regulator n=1 Tax=Vagococcus carniphilus TaxID=218144 RepID=UPI00288E97F0|nr:AraC family transcriptional regulator [Vagococcus carniphilus]MDT2813376.1 AraC family transcriptional regulator [Vagococcus carniphilus]MDT2830170.1 AraC family transcriptional regulator [Vagococcus carniphilus]MDT2838602.1 AraC family transcriptional regulator [Vagococcus carniphilus]MDT2848204.1 AraC family transcriptional regulator [Vagococcus carniphilus]MDT2853440.1 AraC family transcriptional regulator [Vagococcus carniphilus]